MKLINTYCIFVMFKHPKTQPTFIHSFIIHFSSLSASFKEESQSMSFSTFLLVLERAEVVATSLIFASFVSQPNML